MIVDTSWKEVNLEDHVDLVVGYAFKSSGYTDDESDVRLLRGDNVAQGELRWDKAKRWPVADYQRYEAFHLREGDIILAMDRPWISAGLKYARVRRKDTPSLLVQRVARLRGTESLKTDYLRCVIGSADFTDYVLSILTGVNIPHISAKDIKRFRFLLPPVAIQERISRVITSYDDLIENNTRRIEILEEMARRLYEEWFVQFRFPGHEEVGFKESELGRIPESWDLVPLGDIYRTGSGGTPSRKNPGFFGGDYRWVKTKELQDRPVFDTEEKISEEGLQKSSAKLFPRNTVLIAMYGATIGRLGLLLEESATNQACCAVLPNSQGCGWGYAYLSLFSRRQALIDLRAGAAQQNISQDVIKKFKLLRASDELHEQFEMVVTPFLTLCFTLYRKNANLRAQRDLLLPKLISGEIDVSDIPMPT